MTITERCGMNHVSKQIIFDRLCPDLQRNFKTLLLGFASDLSLLLLAFEEAAMESLELADFTEELICFLFGLNTFSFTSEDGDGDED